MTPGPDTPINVGQAAEPVSVTAILNALAEDGFDTQLVPRPEGVLRCSACGTSSPAAHFQLATERRLEGASDPDDMVLVVGAVCPACAAKGSVVLSYGPESSPEDADVVAALPRGSGELPQP